MKFDRSLTPFSWLPLLLTLASATAVAGAPADSPPILPLRERARVIDHWLQLRLDRILPELMRRNEIDMWVLIAREYNEDPVITSMLPATWLSARRRTILVFFDPGGGAVPERFAITRYNVGQAFRGEWTPENQPDQWTRLAELVTRRDPRKIALNTSRTFALADGLSYSEHEAFLKALPESLRGRVVSGENLAVGWLERRIPEEMQVYPSLCRLTHRIIQEGLSETVIQPGVTSTEDVEWWFRERVAELKLETWFHPSVSIQRAGADEVARSFAERAEPAVILPGDLLHVDFGIRYLGLCTDTQQHAYVLKAGENSAPEGLQRALVNGNRLQDILIDSLIEGRTGNQILSQALGKARKAGINATIYTHPLGFHGHAAGPTVGLWDSQGGVPGAGDYPLYAGTVHSIELNASSPVPEWGDQNVRIMLEEDAFFDGGRAEFLDGRQTEFLLIPRDGRTVESGQDHPDQRSR